MAVTMIEQQPGCGPPAPVPILQWEKEFEVLLELWKQQRPHRTLEVGTYHGGTLFHWLQNAHPGQKIVSVDSYAVGVDNRHLYDEWNTNVAELVVIEGQSQAINTLSAVAAHGPYGLVLIDAGHYLAEVTRDWHNYKMMVGKGGILCLHDILTHPVWPSIEVGQLWAEIKKDHLTFEIVADRDAEWGGIGVVLL